MGVWSMFAIANTDHGWFDFLKSRDTVDGINFWTPTSWSLKGLDEGSMFYFMLKSPIRKIGGGGVFREYRDFTVDEVWASYGLRNEFDNKKDFIAALNKHGVDS